VIVFYNNDTVLAVTKSYRHNIGRVVIVVIH